MVVSLNTTPYDVIPCCKVGGPLSSRAVERPSFAMVLHHRSRFRKACNAQVNAVMALRNDLMTFKRLVEVSWRTTLHLCTPDQDAAECKLFYNKPYILLVCFNDFFLKLIWNSGKVWNKRS